MAGFGGRARSTVPTKGPRTLNPTRDRSDYPIPESRRTP